MFNSNKYITETIKLVDSYIIKLHNVAIRMNIELAKLGLDKDDPYTDEELKNLGIRKFDRSIHDVTYAGGNVISYNMLLDREDMSDQTYSLLSENGNIDIYNLNVVSRYDDFELLSWRYYKHLMGEYHSSDIYLLDKYHPNKEYDNNGIELSGIVFKSLDDDKYHTLTKDALIDHPITRLELCKKTEYYINLVDKYGKFETLIKGIVSPVYNVNTIIHSHSGDIIGYDKQYVAVNEHNLIYDVSQELRRYLARWDVIEYTVIDDLYTASLFAGLTTTALYKTLNSRLSKVGTGEVSTFHLEEFFKSNFAVASESKYLTRYSQIWLYKNLKYIIQNVGKEDTLMLMVDNLIEQSPLKISEILIKLKRPIIEDDAMVNHLSPQYDNDQENLYKAEYRSNGNVYSDIGIDNILIQEIEAVEKRHGNLGIIDLSKDKKIVKDTKVEFGRTKVMYLEYEAFVNHSVVDAKHILLDNFIKYAFTRSLDSRTITFKSKYNLTAMDLNFKQASVLAIKFILDIVGEGDKLLSKYKTTTTIYKPVDPISTSNGLFLAPNIQNDCVELLKDIPIFNRIQNRYDLEEYIIDMNLWFFKYNSVRSTIDVGSSAKMDTLLERLITSDHIILSNDDKVIDDILLDYGVELQISSNYEPYIMLEELILAFTGLDIDPNKKNEDLIKAYSSLLNKLTSYTTHIMHTASSGNTGDTFHTLNALYGIDISSIIDADYKCLEDFNGRHFASVDDDKDITTFIGIQGMSYTIDRGDLKHTLDLNFNDAVYSSIPEVRYELTIE